MANKQRKIKFNRGLRLWSFMKSEPNFVSRRTFLGDYEMDHQVYRDDGGDPNEWMAENDENGKWEIAYIVAEATEESLKKDRRHKDRRMVQFLEREAKIKIVRDAMVAQMGEEAFHAMFPASKLDKKPGYTHFGYAAYPEAIAWNRARVFEWRLRKECELYSLPPLFVVNWTDAYDIDMPHFQFIPSIWLRDKDIEERLKDLERLGHVRCKRKDEEGPGCQAHCSYPMRNVHGKFVGVRSCCGPRGRSTLHVSYRSYGANPHGNPVLVERMDSVPEMQYLVECTERCECDGSKCWQRPLQRGRKMELLVFYDKVKGWTVRAMAPIPQGAFVTEYAGEVLSGHKASERKSNYSWEMTEPYYDVEKKYIHRSFTIDAARYGNEGRFFSHSCVPNMIAHNVLVERYGLAFHHVGFFALRHIYVGEELTIDYFSRRDAMRPTRSQIMAMFNPCRCGEKMCRMKEEVPTLHYTELLILPKNHSCYGDEVGHVDLDSSDGVSGQSEKEIVQR